MRAPRFWSNPPEAPGWQARALAPLAMLWTLAGRWRMARGRPARVGVPVICAGNLTAGGTGKTPLVMALVARLEARGALPHVLSRGHGGRLPGPLRVDARQHSAADVGDEPLLLAALVPVWIGADRLASARAAVAAGASVLVMDDGFQNPRLAKDLSIVVVDAVAGFGNGRVIPAGPLREPVAEGLVRADLVLALGPETARARLLADCPALGARPVLAGALEPLPTGMDWAGLRAFAFAGIGRPEKFFATLRALGADVVATRAFADHAPYDARLLARLAHDARASGAQLVTTEKDAVRLPAAFRATVMVLPVRLDFESEAPLDAALTRLGL
jgi:tetraacyldisaccharide 4'-kinase